MAKSRWSCVEQPVYGEEDLNGVIMAINVVAKSFGLSPHYDQDRASNMHGVWKHSPYLMAFISSASFSKKFLEVRNLYHAVCTWLLPCSEREVCSSGYLRV